MAWSTRNPVTVDLRNRLPATFELVLLSLIVTIVAIALLLRIHHELVVDARPVNRKRRAKR